MSDQEIQPDWYVPRLLAMFRTGEVDPLCDEPVAWALTHPSGSLVTITIDLPPQVALWPSKEQAEVVLDAYVHDGQRSGTGRGPTTSPAGDGRLGG